MAVRLRLTRMGRRKKPFYRIVAVDSRVKRDGKYLEAIGFYNPIPEPYELQIDTDRALYWLKKGAQPSDTVRSLFRRKGIMLRWDLIQRGKSEAEIEEEVKKWEVLQQERLKRIEAEKIQKMRSKEKQAEKEAVKEAARKAAEADTEEAKAESEPEVEAKAAESTEAAESARASAESEESAESQDTSEAEKSE
ncbi:MAG: 30S ribosomal protein S16 [candidate division KSB1 bacterium]|nr:30S ribosomal protein S16 [candidate division KSB1 bacterium]MDQ7063630.1 30S ribosomal protein S16 [candidate division KSB1 bacterium]